MLLHVVIFITACLPVLAVLKGGEKRSPFMAACSDGLRVGLPQSNSGGRDLKVPSDEQARKLKVIRENILSNLHEYNEILSEVIGRDEVGDIIQATIVAGCPFIDTDDQVQVNSDIGQAIIEIVSSGQPIDAALTAVFVKIYSIDGETGGGGGSSGGGSGGCHDEAAGVCCAGPCPC